MTTTTTTHISLSGKRVACSATQRGCPRAGHETVPVGSPKEQGFVAAAKRQTAQTKTPDRKTLSSASPTQMLDSIDKAAPVNFFAEDAVIDERKLAKTSSDPQVLTQLAKTKDSIALIGLAANRHVPVNVLTRLSKHKKWGIRAAVAGNPSTPANVKELLKSDPEDWVREAVR